jgi:hypothetical protein
MIPDWSNREWTQIDANIPHGIRKRMVSRDSRSFASIRGFFAVMGARSSSNGCPRRTAPGPDATKANAMWTGWRAA